ncbi:hypothetical protein PY365_04325 [Roseiarcaceae bacterium H3SJ34-1]|uniref:hypothetical protein n=1 Tax=Terripilifer ovatus TaxID=3032367 RepID=UPI003AB96E57|nr:hypothetical protein [Roseiarcaceae bacterium H3SJ34-1]
MTTYGVTPTGFVRKPLDQILADIEARAAAPDVFGPGVIQTPESPLGQLNGLMASLATTGWEIAEAVYQSLDINQAEGARLDMLGRLRLLARAEEETDASFRADITNAGRANVEITDLARAVRLVAGVTWSQVWINDHGTMDDNGQDAHTLCVAAIGGSDSDLAEVLMAYVVPGIGTHGNTPVQMVIEGYCRTVYLMRPEEVPIGFTIQVKAVPDKFGCSPPSNAQIASVIAGYFAGADRPANGVDMTIALLNRIVSCLFSNVEIVSAAVSRPDLGESYALPYVIAFDQIAGVGVADIILSRV